MYFDHNKQYILNFQAINTQISKMGLIRMCNVLIQTTKLRLLLVSQSMCVPCKITDTTSYYISTVI